MISLAACFEKHALAYLRTITDKIEWLQKTITSKKSTSIAWPSFFPEFDDENAFAHVRLPSDVLDAVAVSPGVDHIRELRL